MKTKRNSLWLILVLVLAMALTACGKKEQNKEITPTIEPTKTVQSETTTEPTKEKELRIISFSPSITELIYALDAGELLVGRTDYCDYPEDALRVESIGDFYTPDIEKIVTLEPDIIIASALWTEDVVNKFKEAGSEVLILDEASKVDDVYTIISTLGAHIDREDQANMLIEEMSNEISEVIDKVKGYAPVSVYYVVGFGEYGDYTATGDTYIGEMLTLAGGDNIAKDATGWLYSLETLLEKDPEVILIAQNLLEDFLSAPNYQSLSAVKNGKVYGIESSLIDRQTNRMANGIRAVAEILHPEAFKE